MKYDMNEICGACGVRYGKHKAEDGSGFLKDSCPGSGGSWANTTFKPVDKTHKKENPMYCFKEGTTLQDLINTKPCLDELRRFMDKAGISTVDPRIHLDNEASNRAANSKPEWQDYGLKHGLLEEIGQPLSFKVRVDDVVVWEGKGKKLVIGENNRWVMGFTKKGYAGIGSAGSTNIANDGNRILERK